MKIIKISSIKQVDYDGPVYDLTVDQDHSYNIDRIIVHNSVCSTSVQTAVHSSHVWMIQEIKRIKQNIDWAESNPEYTETMANIWSKADFEASVKEHNCNGFRTKIVADGGINTLDKAIKCLALGYDYVMMGKMFAQCEEACGPTTTVYIYKDDMSTGVTQKKRKYYGMASEQGQIDISGGANKNPEGIETWVEVNTNLEQFTAKFEAALRSTMSYVGAHNLYELTHNTICDQMSIEEFKSYYK